METGTSLEQPQVAEYSLIEYEAIEELRQAQASQLKTAGDSALSSVSYGDAFLYGDRIRTEAEAQLHPQLDYELELYVDAHISKSEQPEQYNQMFALLRSVSAHNMDSAKWYNGDKDADGNYDYTTSGRCQAEAIYDQLKLEHAAVIEEPTQEQAVEPTGNPIDHMSPEAQAVYGPAIAAREALAVLSVERRQMILKNGKKAKELATKYDAARATYEAALQDVTNFYVKTYRDKGFKEETIHQRVLPRLIDEHHKFTEEEYKILTLDNSLRSRVARFLGKRGAMMGLSAVSGYALGKAARAVAGGALMAGVGITGGAAAGGIIGVRSAKNALLAKVHSSASLNKDFDKRRAADKAALEEHLVGNKNVEVDEAARSMHARIGAIITERVEKDRKSNARRVVVSTLIGGATAAAAFELAPCIEHTIGGWFHDSGNNGNALTTPSDHGQYTFPGSGEHQANPLAPPVQPSGPVQVEIPKGPVTIGGNPGGNGSNVFDGFHTNVTVEHGNGYIRELQDLAAQKHVHLSLDQATDAYHHVLNSQGAHFFTNDPNYVYHGDNRISNPGPAIWDHAHIAAFNDWLHQQEAEGKVAA